MAVEGHVVRITVDLMLDPTAKYGQTAGAVLSCAICETTEPYGTLAEVLRALQDHTFSHHHRGAVAVRGPLVGADMAPRTVKMLYGYSVPAVTDPHVAAILVEGGKSMTLLVTDDASKAVRLLATLGWLLDIEPSIMPSLAMHARVKNPDHRGPAEVVAGQFQPAQSARSGRAERGRHGECGHAVAEPTQREMEGAALRVGGHRGEDRPGDLLAVPGQVTGRRAL